jgi:hypothetical protein
MPVHQPPNHEDDQHQPEYAADPNRPALTVIAAAVVPKPAPEENHEQQDDQNKFHRFVFHRLTAFRAERRLAAFHGTDGAGCGVAAESRSQWFKGRVASIDLQ